jgi:hypothetical protein
MLYRFFAVLVFFSLMASVSFSEESGSTEAPSAHLARCDGVATEPADQPMR